MDYDNDAQLDVFVTSNIVLSSFIPAYVVRVSTFSITTTVTVLLRGFRMLLARPMPTTFCSFADYDNNDGSMNLAFTGNGMTDALYHKAGLLYLSSGTRSEKGFSAAHSTGVTGTTLR